MLAALSLYSWHIVFGLGFMFAIIGGPAVDFWTMPVTIGLLVAPFTAIILSQRDVGDWLCNHGLFVSPMPFGQEERRIEPGHRLPGLDEGALADR